MIMFDFLKKKLKEGIEKISKTISREEVSIEKVEAASYEVKQEEIKKEEIEHKEQLIEQAGMQVTPEVEEILEKPYEEKPIEAEPVIEEPKIEPLIEKPKEIKHEPKPEPIKEEPKKPEPIEEPKVEEKPKEKKVGFLGKLLGKKTEEKEAGLIEKIKKKITEKEIGEQDIKDILWDMQVSLMESDVGLEVAEKIVGDIKNALVGKSVKRGEIEKIVKETMRASLKEIMNVQVIDIVQTAKAKKPYVIIFLGFNGVGKTMSIAKLGNMLRAKGLSVVFAAADTWRAAALEQLEVHGNNLGITVIKQKYGSDPAAVIFDAVKHAQSKDIDVVLADTAGRSHSNINLSEELKKMCRVNKPDMKVLVIDVLTGNDAIDQAKLFNDAVGVDALILTKADVYDKGGALISALHTLQKPIIFLGIGQGYEDVQMYDPDKIIRQLLD